MEVMLLEDELSASQSCGQRFKVCSIHIKRPVLATMHVQTSSLLGTGPLKFWAGMGPRLKASNLLMTTSELRVSHWHTGAKLIYRLGEAEEFV